MNTGLAISTYFCEKTPPERLGIFKKSIESLFATGYTDFICVVDDGSTNTDHLTWIESLNIDVKILVIRHRHGGIAKTKNVCIRTLLDAGVDVGFLADDDMLYKNSAWADRYAQAVLHTGIDHYSYFLEDKPCEVFSRGGVSIRKTPSVNGCFMTFTKSLVDKIGYFKILPHDYGHEHSNFSIRAARLAGPDGFYDLEGSGDLLELVGESVTHKSIGSVDYDLFSENERSAILTEFKYEPFIE
jgi:glycosyltransferase involved in cell wall biosynthesis